MSLERVAIFSLSEMFIAGRRNRNYMHS